MDPDAVVGRKHIVGTRGFRRVYFEELDQTTRQLIGKGEQFEGLKTRAMAADHDYRKIVARMEAEVNRYRSALRDIKNVECEPHTAHAILVTAQRVASDALGDDPTLEEEE